MMMVAYLAVLAASCRSASGFSTHRSPVLVHARMGPALTISVSRPKSTALRAGKKPSQSYSDDAFGFVFFASALLARDEVFAATFVAVSAVAATLTVAGKLEGGKRVPAGVAAATLLSTPVISAALAQFGVVASDPNPSARLVELGLVWRGHVQLHQCAAFPKEVLKVFADASGKKLLRVGSAYASFILCQVKNAALRLSPPARQRLRSWCAPQRVLEQQISPFRVRRCCCAARFFFGPHAGSAAPAARKEGPNIPTMAKEEARTFVDALPQLGPLVDAVLPSGARAAHTPTVGKKLVMRKNDTFLIPHGFFSAERPENNPVDEKLRRRKKPKKAKEMALDDYSVLFVLGLLSSAAGAEDELLLPRQPSGASSPPLVKCCGWTDRPECVGKDVDSWLCPASCACQGPGWFPEAWRSDIQVGSLLVASPDEAGGAVSNGYVAAAVPRLMPGTAGPPLSGVEHVKGVFQPKGPLVPGSANMNVGLAFLGSWTATAFIAQLGSQAASKRPATTSAMDLRRGAYYVASTLRDGEAYCVQRTYAHRSRQHILATEFECHNSGDAALKVIVRQMDCTPEFPTVSLAAGGLCPLKVAGGMARTQVASGLPGFICSLTRMLAAETPSLPKAVVAECHTEVPDQGLVFSVPAGGQKTFTLLSARYSSMDSDHDGSSDLVGLAEEAVRLAGQLPVQGLFDEHVAAMDALNMPGIEVTGDLELARVVNASIFALTGAIREDSKWSSAPEGLVSTRYGGHALWDVETWQFPTWLAFWPRMARTCLRYRERLAAMAEANARLPLPYYPEGAQSPHEGLRFPWESAVAGIEQSPGESQDEDHVQGDISWAFQQYWYATGDRAWLQESGFAIIEGIARFYASRVVRWDDDSFHIEHTMGPDEYHSNVTDSAYGNAVAKAALLAAYEIAQDAGRQPNATFKHIADGLVIPYDCKADYHPEYQNYQKGTVIKQADVVLMSYPLEVPMSRSTQRNDLSIYSAAFDPGGVAMTWAIHAISARDIGNEDLAAGYFRHGWSDYAKPPLYSWHEGALGTDGSATQGAPNLVTGAGGFLLSVWAGYGGVRFRSDGSLHLRSPRPPPNCTSLKLRRLHFLGALLDVEAQVAGWSVGLATDSPLSAPAVELLGGQKQVILTTEPTWMPAGTEATIRRHRQSSFVIV
ncbi:unnamed protein product [Polarella glacialis]|uniref:Glycoside hydrolase family 65 central catalytic domain-containing protein n=1 Tax=Polarella glacialis TaxID=89957 RepID=A0A813ER72_POLGL|nr:unnamed protein product [Polarella glacialis]